MAGKKSRETEPACGIAVQMKVEKRNYTGPYYTLCNFYNVIGYRIDKKYFDEAERVLRESIALSPRNQQGYRVW